MPNAGLLRGAARRGLLVAGIALGLIALAGSVAIAQAQAANVLMFSGTTGYRHGGGNEAIQPDVVEAIQDALADAGMESDYHTCNGTGTGGGALPGCRNETLGTPAIFTEENLAQYDAIFFWQASSQFRNNPSTGPLFNASERAAIEGFVNDGGGIAAMHASMTMAAGDVTWDWWDAPGDSAIGALMPGHSATDINNVATVEVSDRNHPSTRDLPDSWEFGGEHYTYSTNVRGTHHVLMTLDEESYDLGGAQSMGADHPIAWCRLYDGGKIWGTSLGHFAAPFRENGFDNELMTHLVGGVAWAAGVQGNHGDCGGTVWSNFTRTVLADDLNGAIGLDVADDGKVYWTEIGTQGIDSEGRLRMWDPDSGDTRTLETIESRADYQSSNAGVLGMALDPDFESNRHLYVYYSPRVPAADSNCDNPAPNCVADSSWIPGHNVVSRFTLNGAGDDVVDGSEQEILRVPKVQIGNNNQDGLPPDTYSAHQGGAGLSFDSEGNLYLGTGDDVDPFGDSGNYAPIDQRFPERYDARNTSANTNDLRGKILRINPLEDASGDPGAGDTYEIPDGNMFAPGTPQTRPEIYAMGFRNPFTVLADPADPGTVVVGEYAPDAGGPNPDRGPAGVIEWDHITEPGFHGWPLCTGDNSTEHSYNRYEFPGGPSGDRFDCQADEIPNESDFQTGLDQIPGPAAAADIWTKPGGGPSRFNVPNGRDEANTGPVYRYDPDNPSTSKWPAYYDGSWLIFNRNQNWWREARMTDDGSELLTVNGFFQPNQFSSPPHDYVIPTRFGPDGSLYVATWNGGCCRSSLPGIGQGQLMRIDYVPEEEPDTTPPVTTLSLDGAEPEETYDGPVEVSLSATDEEGGSGVDYTEFRLDAETHDVEAETATWTPDELEIARGDDVRWHFPADTGQPHDVWLIPPGEEPDSEGFEVTDGAVIPGGDPVSHTFDQEGTWWFVCKIHSFVANGEWTGMVGTIDVGPGGEGWTDYEGLFTIGEDGAHRVEYRSADVAGNLEETRTVAFEIAGGEPRLHLRGAPGIRRVGPNRKFVPYRLVTRNIGDGELSGLRVCARSPRRRAKVRGQICRVVPAGLDPGERHVERYRLRVRRPARGKLTRIRMTANGPGVNAERDLVRLRVRR